MAQSDSEAESVESLISESQQFKPEDDDADNLWEVEGITAERRGEYKVKWVGLDPMTMKPWAQSWVPKKDCTPDLVLVWKAKKKEQERRKSTTSKRGRSSTASRKNGRTSTASTVVPKASTSKLPDTRRSTSTVHAPTNGEVVTTRRRRSSATSPRSTSAATTIAKRKRNSVPDAISEVEVESEDEVVAAQKASMKGRKRKIAEAESAHNSANVPVDVNINEDGETIAKRVVSRPKKKRKVDVELVAPKVEPQDDEDLRRSLSLSQQSHPQTTEEDSYRVEKSRSKAIVQAEEEEEEEEVRMVEDALSQGINSPPPIEHFPEPQETDDSVHNKMADLKGKGRAVDFTDGSQVDELMEEDSILASTKARNNKPTKTSAKTKTSVRPTSTVTPTSKVKTKATVTTKDTALKFGPPSRNTLASPTARSSKISGPLLSKANGKSLPTRKPARPPPPRMTTVPYRRPDPRSDDDSESGHSSKKNSEDVHPPDKDSDDDSDDESDNESGNDPPPLLYLPVSSQPRRQLPTEEPSPFWLGRPERNLSPAALERLRRFDEEVLNAHDDEDHESQLSVKALERLRRFDEEIATQQEPFREPLQREPGRSKNTGPVQGLLEVASTANNQTPSGDQPQPSAYPEEPIASSSKMAHGSLVTRGDDAESGKDEETLERRQTFVPDMSSVLMRASGFRQAAPPNARKSTVTALDVDVETRSSSSKASKKTTTSKSKLTSSSNGGAASAKPNSRQRISKPSSHSYDHDVIPETEAEDSQSQPQPQPLDLNLPTPVPTTYSTLLHPPPSSTPGGRSTIRSKMRPRTPLSRASSDAGAGPASKSLRPIPMLTPSTFHPHLPELEPFSSLPESISDVTDSVQHLSSKIITQDTDSVMDSIEDFDSPVKPSKRSGPRTKFVVNKERQKESAEDVWNSGSVKRGQEIAEAAKRRAAGARANSPARPKKTLDEIRASRSRSASNVSNSNAQKAVNLAPETIVEEENEEMQDLSNTAIPPASGPRSALQDDNITLREMEDAYVDLSGGVDDDDNTHAAKLPPHIALRQEEEESTQDDMQGVQSAQMEDVQVETSKSSSENAVARLVLRSEGSNDSSESIPKIVVQDASRPASPRPYSEDGSQLDVMRTTRSRSRSQTPAVVNQANTRKSNRKKLDVASNKSRGDSVAPSRQASLTPNDNNDADIHNRLNAALTLVAIQSEDLTRLKAELASQQAKSDEELERTKSSFRENIDMLTARMTTDQKVWEQRMADTDTKNHRLLEEKKEWDTERAWLIAQAEAATQSKVTADNEREFFREQYAKASGFVSSVRDENKELEKRIKIAEDQAQSGVALIKATFELRVRNLESDIKSWRKMAEFLIEKDRRTDNDTIRRRAAEHPELASRCDRQERAFEMLKAQVDQLEDDAEEKERGRLADKAELDQWKKETTRLNIELNEALTKLDRIGRTGDNDQSSDPDRTSNEFVYCCQWKTYDGFETTSCREVFSTMSGLEQHLLSGGHLHHT